MKEFLVQFERVNNECNTVESFDTLQEAVNYANDATKGMELAKGDIENDRATACRYVVITWNEDKEEEVEHYATPYYWE